MSTSKRCEYPGCSELAAEYCAEEESWYCRKHYDELCRVEEA